MKRFIKEKGHADAYENLKITFISGKSPVLHLKDDNGKIIEEIDLSGYTTDGLHSLMHKKVLFLNIICYSFMYLILN